MDHTDNVIEIRKPVKFTIDGRTYMTSVRWQPAANLLLLAGLDPTHYELSEVRRGRLRPVRYESSDIVGIHRSACFVSIHDQADTQLGADL